MKLALPLYSHVKSTFDSEAEERNFLRRLERLILTFPHWRRARKINWGACRRAPALCAPFNAAQSKAMPGCLVLNIHFLF